MCNIFLCEEIGLLLKKYIPNFYYYLVLFFIRCICFCITTAPGVGSVMAVVKGPSSAQVRWTLAFSGGIPVDTFLVDYRRNDSSKWNSVRTITGDAISSSKSHLVVSPWLRQVIAYGLESMEFYVFRVAGSNHLGVGDYIETDVAILSHLQGVPSSPSQPQIHGWGKNTVVISTSIPKFGSQVNFSLSIVVFLNQVQVSTMIRIDLPEDYQERNEILLTLANISYRGEKTFQALATNFLGPSLPSDVSLEGKVGMLIVY